MDAGAGDIANIGGVPNNDDIAPYKEFGIDDVNKFGIDPSVGNAAAVIVADPCC